MEWKYDDSLPIYTQLVEQMKRAIVSGAIAPGERLAAVREMAMEAGVNPNTMQRALQELERCGLVYAMRSSGRYVTDEVSVIDAARDKLAEETIFGFIENMSRLGFSREESIRKIREHEEVNNDDNI